MPENKKMTQQGSRDLDWRELCKWYMRNIFDTEGDALLPNYQPDDLSAEGLAALQAMDDEIWQEDDSPLKKSVERVLEQRAKEAGK